MEFNKGNQLESHEIVIQLFSQLVSHPIGHLFSHHQLLSQLSGQLVSQQHRTLGIIVLVDRAELALLLEPKQQQIVELNLTKIINMYID